MVYRSPGTANAKFLVLCTEPASLMAVQRYTPLSDGFTDLMCSRFFLNSSRPVFVRRSALLKTQNHRTFNTLCGYLNHEKFACALD